MRVTTLTAPRRLTGHRAILATLAGAAATVVCAQIAFYIPGKPIPVTMQVFAVICCALVLGGRLGALAQLEYLAVGAAGAPVFATIKAGPMALVGPAGGYLVGFVIAAYVAGTLFERSRRDFAAALIAGLIAVALIHLFGVMWLATAHHTIFGGITPWLVGSVPFIGIDTAKALFAALLYARRTVPPLP